MSCHKNLMTTCYITLWWEQVTSWQRPCQPYIFCSSLSTLKAIKSNLKWLYDDKRNLTVVVIPYEIQETWQALFINFIWNDYSCKILYIYQKAAMTFIHWSAHSLSAYDLDPIFHGSLNLSGALAVFCEQKDHFSTGQEELLHYIFICLHKNVSCGGTH